MIVLGVDPGFAALGLAAVDVSPDGEHLVDCWVVTTEPSTRKQAVRDSEDNARRAREITRALQTALDVHRPTVVAAETMSWPRNASSAAKVALAWGALCALLERGGLPLVQASPQDVKRAVCGVKNASKDDVALAVEARFPEVTWPTKATLQEHAADAIAVVVACLDSELVRLARRAA